MKRLISQYYPNYPKQLTYMFQMVEYSPINFLKWWLRVKNFRTVNKRRDFVSTSAAKGLLVVAYVLAVILLAVATLCIYLDFSQERTWLFLSGVAGLLFYPLLLALLLMPLVAVLRAGLVKPKQKKLIAASAKIFKDHQATVIAVAGSYGKTTMKENLYAVLAKGGKTKATEGNKNVAVSHAAFARLLDGDEKFVIVEFGEGYKDDVKRFSATVQPNIGVITGIAPNHLDQYKTMQNLETDLMSLADYLGHKNTYLSGDDKRLAALAQAGDGLYKKSDVLGWTIEDIQNDLTGLKFNMIKGQKKLVLKSGLVGEHLVSPLAFAAALADTLGLTKEQIEAGIAETKPFEHRLEPRNLNGAWIIDDTYNGNLEGMRAGLELLKSLKVKGRKVYITPGLVDQAGETQRVHIELGGLIADAKPDEVVLMENSVLKFIKQGIEAGNYQGEIKEVVDPLKYYENLDLTLAAGDVVLMQNDWTDNYA